MFTIAKVFLVSLLAATAYAAPSKREEGLVTCDYVFTPNITVNASTTNLVSEFDFVIVTALFDNLPPNSLTDSSAASFVDNGNNSFNVEQSIRVEGKTAAQTAAILTGLVGTSHTGFANGGTIDWTFNSVSCDA